LWQKRRVPGLPGAHVSCKGRNNVHTHYPQRQRH
jgi:hypothetical protein